MYGVRVPASCVLYVPKAQGSLPKRPRTVRTSYAYQPRACHTHPALWHHRLRTATQLPWKWTSPDRRPTRSARERCGIPAPSRKRFAGQLFSHLHADVTVWKDDGLMNGYKGNDAEKIRHD